MFFDIFRVIVCAFGHNYSSFGIKKYLTLKLHKDKVNKINSQDLHFRCYNSNFASCMERAVHEVSCTP